MYWFKITLIKIKSVQARGFKVWGWVNICVPLPFPRLLSGICVRVPIIVSFIRNIHILGHII